MSAWSIIRSLVPGGEIRPSEEACYSIAWAQNKQWRDEALAIKAAWKTERLYYTSDFAKLYETIFVEGGKAYNGWVDAINQGAANYDDYGGRSPMTKAVGELGDLLKGEGEIYKEAAEAALAAKLDAVDSPGFRRWGTAVAEKMQAIHHWAFYSTCRKYALDRAMDALIGVIERALGLIKRVVGAVVEVVKTVVTTVLAVPDALSRLWTSLKWGLFLGGSAFVVIKGKQLYDQRRLGGGAR